MAEDYKNEARELEASNPILTFPNTHPLKNESTYQLGMIFVISNFYIFLTKLNVVLIQDCKTQSLYTIQDLRVVQNHNLHNPQNRLKNGFCGTFYFIYTFSLLLIKELILMNSRFESWIEKNCSSQGRKNLVKAYFREIQPSISEILLSALIDIFFYYSTSDEFFTSIEEIGKIIGYQKTQTGEILQKLEELNFILKRRGIYFKGEKSLVIQLINIEPLSSFLRDKPLQFLATYIKTEKLHTRCMVFKAAVFKDVHDLDNVITIKTDRISYDDETSNFLKKLNADDVISYTASITKPTFKGIKHPLNLKMHFELNKEALHG